MKVYLHTDADPAFTKVIYVVPERHSTVQDLVRDFVDAYQQKHGDAATAHVKAHAVQVFDSNRRALDLNGKLTKVLHDHDDVFIEWSGVSQQTTTALQPAPAVKQTACTPAPVQLRPAADASPSPPQDAAAAKAVQGSALASSSQASLQDQVAVPAGQTVGEQGAAVHSDEKAELHKVGRVLHLYVSRAQAAVESSNFRQAGEIYTKLLELLPKQPEILLPAATMWLHKAHQPQRAEPLARRLIAASPALSIGHQLLGDCLMALEKPQEAVGAYDNAVAAAQAAEEGAQREADLKVSEAEALFACKTDPALQDLAAKLVMDVLSVHESHWAGLRLYARIAEQQGMHDDALRVALRVLVTRSQDTETRALLARRLQAPGGFDTLYQELSVPQIDISASARSNRSSTVENSSRVDGASPFAFLAMCVKDVGAVDATITLLEKAVSLHPSHVGYHLTLAHAWELNQRLDRVLDVAARGMRLVVEHGLRLTDDVNLPLCADLLSSLPRLEPPVVSLDWYLTDNATATSHPSVPSSDGAMLDDVVVRQAPSGAETAATPVPPQTDKTDMDMTTGKVRYTSAQLDLLALCFTAVKVLYVGGALSTANRLVRLLMPARDASEQPLHTTLIRNEAAYFGCVVQLFGHPNPTATSTQPPPTETVDTQIPTPISGTDTNCQQPTPTATVTSDTTAGPSGRIRLPRQRDQHAADDIEWPMHPPLYLLGDSHTLSGAWQHVTLRGSRRLLQPILITGCKIWHLRPASMFYPKSQFTASVRALPPGSQVIVLLGEIDCREALLLAVQKCKYDSTAQGIDATITIYMQVLTNLITHNGFEVFVHPVPPVLNETREVVNLFNAALKSKVRSASETCTGLRGRLHWLNFDQDLLTADGSRLAEELHFDGTHLSPAYVCLLERELAAIS